MGLFDFLKPKKSTFGELTEKDPHIRKILLRGLSEFAGKEAANLRAVGRNEDADKRIGEYLQMVFQEFKNEPQNPRHLSLLTDVALKLDAVEAAIKTLESVIEANDHFSLDLTSIYTDLGRLYHGGDQKRELWCYEMAASAKSPPGCKFPATRQQKAKAHQFASFVYVRLTDWGRADSHAKKAQELVPEVNWEDQNQINKFMLAE
jgi:tetratricopeptide (TPR) repeat protein